MAPLEPPAARSSIAAGATRSRTDGDSRLAAPDAATQSGIRRKLDISESLDSEKTYPSPWTVKSG